MSSLPCYADLGKSAKDLFTKGYHYGQVKLDASSRAQSGTVFKTACSLQNDTGRISGSLETKQEWSTYGLTATGKWNTDNVFNTTVAIENQFLDGLKVTFDTTLAPHTGKKSAKVKSVFKHKHAHLTGDVDLDIGGATLRTSGVFGHCGFQLGYNAAFDTGKSQLAGCSFAAGYAASDFSVQGTVNRNSEFMGTLYHKVTSQMEAGAQLQWAAGSSTVEFGVAGKYKLDETSSMRLKVNNQSHLGLAYSQDLRPGVQLTLSGLLHLRSIDQPGHHRLGIGLDLSA